MKMLQKQDLGRALTEAMQLKGVGPTEVAAHFGVQPPSVSSAWQKRGSIAKKHIGKLVEYFSDVVGPEHWGMTSGELVAASVFHRKNLSGDIAQLADMKLQEASEADTKAQSVLATKLAQKLDAIPDIETRLNAYTACIEAISEVAGRH